MVSRQYTKGHLENYFGVKLMPCPFCGGTEVHAVAVGDVYVECSNTRCGAAGPMKRNYGSSSDRDSAIYTQIEAWNQRANPDRTVGMRTMVPPNATEAAGDGREGRKKELG